MFPKNLKTRIAKTPSPDDVPGEAAPSVEGGTSLAGDAPEATPTEDQTPEEKLNDLREEKPEDTPEEEDAPKAEDQPEEEDKPDDAPEVREPPASAEEYDFTLPEDSGLKNEKGEPFQFDANDPFVAEFRELAFADGMSQKALTDAMSLYAKVTSENSQALADAQKSAQAAQMKADLEALSYKSQDGSQVTGEARIEAVLASLQSLGGPDLKADLVPAFVNKKTTLALEKLVGLASEGKISNGKNVTSDDLDGLTGEQKLEKLRTV